MMRVLSTAWVFAGCLLAACSGDGRGKADPNADTNHANAMANNLNNSVFEGEICADDVEFCSRAQCRLCRYTDEVVTESGEWPVMRLGPEPVVAYYDDRTAELKVARRAAPNDWQVETAWATPNIGERSLQMALDPDGAPWITLSDTDRAVTLVYRDNDGWTAEPLDGVFDVAPIALDGAGTPWIVYAPITGGLELAGRINGIWETTTVEDGTNFITTRTIFADDDGVWIAWVNREASELRVAFWDGDSLDVEVAMTNPGDNLLPLSLSMSRAGGVLGVSVGGRVAIRDANGTWTDSNTDASGDNNVLLLQPDRRTLVAYEFFGLAVAQQAGAEWPSQLVSTRCDSEALDAAVGPDDELYIVYWCRGEITFMAREGMYDEGYAAECRALTTALCDAALECNPDASDTSGDLCLYHPGGSTNCINVPYCETDYYGAVCGDATQDPALVTTCAAAMASECRNEGDDGGVVLPNVCTFR